MVQVSSVGPFWERMPEDLMVTISHQLKPSDYRICKEISKFWNEIVNNNHFYWEARCKERFGEHVFEKILMFSEFAEQFKNKTPCYFKIFYLLQKNQLKFLNIHPNISTADYKKEVFGLVSLKASDSKGVDFVFFDEQGSIRKLDYQPILKRCWIPYSQELVSIPSPDKPSCLFPIHDGILIGSELGFIYFSNLKDKERKLTSLFTNSFMGRITQIQGSTYGKNVDVLVVMIAGGTIQCYHCLKPLDSGENQIIRIDSHPTPATSFPVFIAPHLAFWGSSQGYVCLFDFERAHVQMIDLCSALPKMEITAVCNNFDRVIVGTNQGRVGWVMKNSQGLASNIHWISELEDLSKGSKVHLTSIGNSGFYVSFNKEVGYPVLFKLNGDLQIGQACGYEIQDPIWFENGTVYYTRSGQKGLFNLQFPNNFALAADSRSFLYSTSKFKFN